MNRIFDKSIDEPGSRHYEDTIEMELHERELCDRDGMGLDPRDADSKIKTPNRKKNGKIVQAHDDEPDSLGDEQLSIRIRYPSHSHFFDDILDFRHTFYIVERIIYKNVTHTSSNSTSRQAHISQISRGTRDIERTRFFCFTLEHRYESHPDDLSKWTMSSHTQARYICRLWHSR